MAGPPGEDGAARDRSPRAGGPALRDAAAAALLAAALYVPWLGSEGLWDPWEPHYGEVAREMVERGDWVRPHWQEAWFFSKPPLLPWLGGVGLALAGVHEAALPPGSDPAPPAPTGVSARAEWALRLPVALLAALGVAATCAAVARLASRRAGLLSAAALATSPLQALLARQAVPDAPFVALTSAGALSFAVAVLDARAGPGWAYAGWLLLGFATLAKGPLGAALVALAFLAWFAATGEWRRMGRVRILERVGPLRLPLGPLAFLAVAGPWLAALTLFDGRDDEGRTFVERFWIHDHFRRLATGVHVPVPAAGFDYYLAPLAHGTFPWVAALPGALGEGLRARPRSRDPRDELALLCGIWALVAWGGITLSATKYPHYALPVVPPLAILSGLFLDRLLREGPADHLPALALGLAAFVAVGLGLAARPKALADLVAYDPRRPWPERELAALHPATRLGPLAFSLHPRAVLNALVWGGGATLALGWLRRSVRGATASLAAIALATSIWLSWVHWRELSPHWTQRDLFRAWLAGRRSPDEPVVAFLMNWRGETFYGRNRVRQVTDPGRLAEIAARPGPVWVIVEQARQPALRAALGPGAQTRVAAENARYALVEVRDGDAPGR
jgi:4-amino-4-deoxy-L-arabinose transferase-like glycosyltransferase